MPELYRAESPAPVCSHTLSEAWQGKLAARDILPFVAVQIAGAFAGVAAARAALDWTLEYVKERTAFGQPVGSFQNSRFVLAEIATEISRRMTRLSLWSMGSGAGCDAQYLFATDVLGETRGHIPRHSKVYRRFADEYDRLQRERVDAFREFVGDVPWAHLDIAGTAYLESDGDLFPRGATGSPVRTLVRFLLAQGSGRRR